MRSMGLDVIELDTSTWLPSGSRLIRSVVQRTFLHPTVHRMNMQLRSLVAQKRYDVVWIEKGEWIYPGTLASIRQQECFLVHYNTDDLFGRYEHFWLHRLGIKNYDLYLTTNRHNVREIRHKYGVTTMRVGMGYDADLHRLCRVPKLGKPDVVFIGHWELHTEEFVMALREAGIGVQVWGYNWWKARDLSLRGTHLLPHGEYVSAIAQAKIALCSLSRWNRNESTGRSFEIPAIGTFMLAEHTPEHEYIYGDGIGAALFSNVNELVAKARHYLGNVVEREALAAAGHLRSQSPGYSWANHLVREWPIVERALTRYESASDPDEDAPFWPGFRQGAPAPASRTADKQWQ